MISIKARQGTILEITRQSGVRSQEELSALLQARGIHVTQSTLSRDIRELGLVKIRGKYGAPGSPPATSDESLRRAFKQFIIRSGVSSNIVMIKTSPGNAHSIGAVLDAAQWPEVLGTVAGDDTVFVLLQKASAGKIVMQKIKEFSL